MAVSRPMQVCRAHFYKLLLLVIIALMALQYGLSTTFYGGKSYFYVAVPLLYAAPTPAPENAGKLNTSTAVTRANKTVATLVATNHAEPGPERKSASAEGTETPANGKVNDSTSSSQDGHGARGFSSYTESSWSDGTLRTTTATVATTPELPLCPEVPPKLVGPVKVWTDAPSFEELEKLHSDLEPGGLFRPPDCKSRHRVAIIIPYRDREKHLRIFLHNIHPILKRQQLDYGIYVVEEAGQTKFNRAMLMNIGYAEALKQYDYQCFIFHDVDLLPEDDRNIYSCPEQPRHMSVAVNTMNYKLPYADIFGGVSALTKEQMEKVNGFSNEFWGWGGEDDDMASRVKYHGYKIIRYSPQIARYTMMKHTKDKPNPDRYNKLYKGKSRFSSDGVNSLKYKRLDLVKKGLYTWVYVELEQPK